MDPALILPAGRDNRWDLARQIGVEHAVLHPSELGDPDPPVDPDDLRSIVERFEAAGLSLSVLEGDVPITETTRLGRAGRDVEIETFCSMLRTLGELEVPVVCYTWSDPNAWLRTTASHRLRGGSLTTGFDRAEIERDPGQAGSTVSETERWDALAYFLDQVVPVAEEAGVRLALHPDDPPLPVVRGESRIIRSVEAYDRVLGLHPSEANGVCFCQGNFAAMGENIPATIRHFGEAIHYVHFRDIDGTADSFIETWHDNGPTDMAAAIQAYRDVGFDGPIRPDHVPTTVLDDNVHPGYEMTGRLFAIGYLRGLLEGADHRPIGASDGRTA